MSKIKGTVRHSFSSNHWPQWCPAILVLESQHDHVEVE
jgi:hypothetical protein